MKQIAPRRHSRIAQEPADERLHIRLPRPVLEALMERSRQTDVPMSRIITRLLRQELYGSTLDGQ